MFCYKITGKYEENQRSEPEFKFECCYLDSSNVVVVVVVITPPLLRDGGTARTAIQVHAVNLIDIRLRERWQPRVVVLLYNLFLYI